MILSCILTWTVMILLLRWSYYRDGLHICPLQLITHTLPTWITVLISDFSTSSTHQGDHEALVQFHEVAFQHGILDFHWSLALYALSKTFEDGFVPAQEGLVSRVHTYRETIAGVSLIAFQVSINQSNFYSVNIPREARLSGVAAESVFNSKIEETVP